jgi:hypothetical protein
MRPWAMVSRKTSRPVVFGGSNWKYGCVVRNSSTRDWLTVLAAPIFAVLVALLSVGEVAHGGIDEDIARARVKVAEVRVESTIIVGVRRDKADVGNATDVLAGAELGGVMEEE